MNEIKMVEPTLGDEVVRYAFSLASRNGDSMTETVHTLELLKVQGRIIDEALANKDAEHRREGEINSTFYSNSLDDMADYVADLWAEIKLLKAGESK